MRKPRAHPLVNLIPLPLERDKRQTENKARFARFELVWRHNDERRASHSSICYCGRGTRATRRGCPGRRPLWRRTSGQQAAAECFSTSYVATRCGFTRGVNETQDKQCDHFLNTLMRLLYTAGPRSCGFISSLSSHSSDKTTSCKKKRPPNIPLN